MELFYDLHSHSNTKTVPSVITIGNFDGIHLGHQSLIQKMKALATQDKNKLAVISFLNHPSEVLRGSPTCLLSTRIHKVELFRQLGVETLFLLEFSKEFAALTAKEFIDRVQLSIPFNHLILGYDAAIGKDRHGSKEHLSQLAAQYNFKVEYLPPLKYGDMIISSSKIREAVRQGNLILAKELLGRNYSIYAQVCSGQGKGKAIGFPTANLSVEGLCTPPLGVYAVRIKREEHTFFGVANLGTAPTIRDATTPLLEIHVFDLQEDIYFQMVEVEFIEFIRSEKKFASIEDLKQQIQQDVKVAKDILYTRST